MLPVLLLVALAAEPRPFETTALSVDVDFTCRTHVTRSLVLTPETQALLEVPKGCPDAGRAWRLMLQCREGQCTGAVLAEAGSIARVHGPQGRLSVTPLAKEHPATLERLRVRVTSQQSLHVEAEDLRQRPLELRFHAAPYSVSYTVDTVMTEVPTPKRGSNARLVVQAERADLDHARVRVWNERQELLVERTLRFEEPVSLDCARSAGWCTGEAELSVREAHPR
ncbi:hypothetical protein FGE12_03885 [Aggregicoccus sp. 17bor-14]|uniref:hypothetical protein n=1 Tax=Myxococcaceae TaxID=31 RepID=UPI00129D09E0|nr:MULTISPECIES: hypothetical protein [Myxococcaceae]MBF5041515.1 hypothetical protein [Simulacricoccus sp. 17bor-14]MRI87299.1 hypothetical protein [Aggregicoccus sp. 17bor-14]